jgi:hypothetical protein
MGAQIQWPYRRMTYVDDFDFLNLTHFLSTSPLMGHWKQVKTTF